MDYRGLSVIGVWFGAIALSALFLNFNFTTDVIMALVIAAIVLTVYVVRLKPEGSVEMEKIMGQLEALNGRLSALEKTVDEVNKLLEE
jgi:membrane protein implicated in regulation of membrane protease activity